MEKILILGGTNFIGRSLVERLIHQKKYELTLLNRGSTNPILFPGVKKILGDRNTKEIEGLVNGNWDYIIDLSCYFPRSIERIISSISSEVKKYIFISTVSVYEDGRQVLKDESAPTQICTKEDYDDETVKSYGKRKVACEDLINSSGINYTILRPALVYGKYDHTDRFYYWLNQVKKHDRILVPNKGIQELSLTYVQDLIAAIELSINEGEDKNTYNVISHPEVSIAKIIEIVSELLNKSPILINRSSKFLFDNKISEWVDMPLWIDSYSDTYSNKKILRSYNLEVTQLEKSIADTIKYYQELNWPIPRYGMTRSKQLELIKNDERNKHGG